MLYREMFDEVHAPQGLKEEVMNMTRQETTRVVRKVSAAFVIAAVLAVVLAGTALAAVIGVPETLQEWFGKQWTESGGGEMSEEQSAVIDSLVQPVGVSAKKTGNHGHAGFRNPRRGRPMADAENKRRKSDQQSQIYEL